MYLFFNWFPHSCSLWYSLLTCKPDTPYTIPATKQNFWSCTMATPSINFATLLQLVSNSDQGTLHNPKRNSRREQHSGVFSKRPHQEDLDRLLAGWQECVWRLHCLIWSEILSRAQERPCVLSEAIQQEAGRSGVGLWQDNRFLCQEKRSMYSHYFTEQRMKRRPLFRKAFERIALILKQKPPVRLVNHCLWYQHWRSDSNFSTLWHVDSHSPHYC